MAPPQKFIAFDELVLLYVSSIPLSTFKESNTDWASPAFSEFQPDLRRYTRGMLMIS